MCALSSTKLKQVFHPSTKVKSQPSFFPGNAWRAPQFILDMLGSFQEIGWEQGPACCKWDRFVLQTWTRPPSLCVIQQCVSCLHSLLL